VFAASHAPIDATHARLAATGSRAFDPGNAFGAAKFIPVLVFEPLSQGISPLPARRGLLRLDLVGFRPSGFLGGTEKTDRAEVHDGENANAQQKFEHDVFPFGNTPRAPNQIL
jgi:hypothetical protein